MYTANELQLLRNADPGVTLPGVDTPTGNLLPAGSLKPLSALSTNSSAPISYNPGSNVVTINQAGATLSGYNLGSAQVYIRANNVTVSNCNFTQTGGYWAIETQSGFGNATIANNTFDGGAVSSSLAAWIISSGTTNITNNKFLNTPSDGIDVSGGGVISGNYFSGAGYTPTGHPDAIWITNSAAPLAISNNFIDWTSNDTSNHQTNDCIRVTAELGGVSNVTIQSNYLVGGAFCIDAGNFGTNGTFSNISVANNYLGFATNSNWYTGPMTGVTLNNNVIYDYTNVAYSTAAWSAYQAAGLPTPTLLVSTNGSTISSASASGPATLYGSVGAHLNGGPRETNYVGGFGTQYIWCATGANIFTYLSPADSTVARPDYITNFDPAKDVIDLSAVDASLLPGVFKTFTFIGANAFDAAGAEVRYQQNLSSDTTTIQVALAGDTTPTMQIVINALVTPTAANFALTAAQSQAALANGAALPVPTTGYADPMRSYSYTNVQGRSFTSYTSFYSSSTLVADALNLSASNGELDLMSVANVGYDAVTVTRGGGRETIAGQGKAASVTYHVNETIQAGNAGAAETFAFSAGFGNETINGFGTSGAGAEMLQLSAAAFSYLTPGMSQAQDLAAVLATATGGPSATTIVDSAGDRLTLNGVSVATLSANPELVKFF